MMPSRCLATTLFACAVLVSTMGGARADEPDHVGDDVAPARVVTYGLVGGQVNPPAVLVRVGASYHRTLERGDVGSDGAYLEAGGALTATPAYVAPSAYAEWSPAPWFVLRGQYEALGFVGTTRGVVSVSSSRADFSDSALSNASARAGVGHKLAVTPMLRARFGPVVVLHQVDAAYYRYIGDGPLFYEIQHDTLVARGDVVLDSRTDVLFDLSRGGRPPALFVGPSYSLTRAIRTEVQRQRVGGALAFVFANAWGPVRRPTLLLDVGVNAEDRNRAGEPFAALGLRGEMQ